MEAVAQEEGAEEACPGVRGRRRCPGVSRPAGGHQEARSRGQRATRSSRALGWKWEDFRTYGGQDVQENGHRGQ